MPKVHFVTDNQTIDVPRGTPLANVVEEHGLSIPFGCHEGQCGTCMIIVHAGMESFQPMAPNERETLEAADGGPENRLCCQAIVLGDMTVEAV